jgi:hypothetical protein
MAGKGPAPKPERYRRNAPARGEWKPSPDGGWQHELPEPPAGISPAAVDVWQGWFRSWWAGNWGPDDLPSLRLVIRLWDRVNRGDIRRAAELRQWMDSYGITPKGQQDRRWVRPAPPRPPSKLDAFRSRYAHLRDTWDTDPPPQARSRFKDLDDPRPNQPD